MAVYDKKECVNTCKWGFTRVKTSFGCFYTWIMAIGVSYFQSGSYLNILWWFKIKLLLISLQNSLDPDRKNNRISYNIEIKKGVWWNEGFYGKNFMKKVQFKGVIFKYTKKYVFKIFNIWHTFFKKSDNRVFFGKMVCQFSGRDVMLHPRESRLSCDFNPEFYPGNPGLTPAWDKTTEKYQWNKKNRPPEKMCPL